VIQPVYQLKPRATHVGDLDSEERGTGARDNANKVPYHLVPIRAMAETILGYRPDSKSAKALVFLGLFQATRSPAYLYMACQELGLDGWEDGALVFEYGAKKYAEWNWSKGMPWSVPLGCAVRHLLEMIEQGDASLDHESNLPLRGHVFCNIAMLITFLKTYPEGDDFAPAGSLA
jgi:hypothetical protein